MAAAMPIMSEVGGIISGAGAIAKGRMTSNSLLAQAGLEREQANEAVQAGGYDAYRQEIKATQVLGHATAAYGASGVDSSSASEQAVLMAGAQNAELDRQNILHGAEIRAIHYQNQASLDEFGANSALQGSYFAALGSVLGASSSAASSIVAGGTSNPGNTPAAPDNFNIGPATQLPAENEGIGALA